jgi:acetyl esterase/lipase
MLYKLLIFSVMNLLLTACTTVGFYIANAGVSSAEMCVERNIAYGEKPYQILDIYRPKAHANGRVLVFFYGGGWTDGSKDDYAFVADRFVRQGYTVVLPDYGKYPMVTYPTFVEESAAAVAWVKHHVKPTSLFVMGHSAGAYNAVMMASDARYLSAYGVTQSDIDGVIGIAGPYEFTPKEKKYQQIFNYIKNYTPMHVSTFVTKDVPPMLLLHGLGDDVVLPFNTKFLASHLKEVGGKVQVITYPDIGHIQIIGAITKRWEYYAPVADDISNFMNEQAKQ